MTKKDVDDFLDNAKKGHPQAQFLLGELYFHGDDRYMITLGKTPGDSRAAANAASIAINTIVC